MENEIRILMLEDSADDAGLIQHVLRKNDFRFSLQISDSRESYASALSTYQPDLVICDHGLPQFNSTDALKMFKDSQLPGPFILVTGTVSEEFAVDFLKKGADDYILKSSLSRLPSAIANALDRRKAERIKRMAEIELEKQNKLLNETVHRLQRTNNELDHFIYSVSHSLRAPLTSVLGLINLSKLGPNTESTLMSLMEQSINRLDKILKDILSYSYNTSGDISVEPLNLDEEFYLAVRRLQYFPGWNQVTFKSKLKSDSLLYSDSFRIRLILTSLVMNAIYFRDETKPENLCKLSVQEEDTRICFQIEDNGIGIEAEYHESIFEMFFKASQRGDGAGLGLYLVKEAVRKLKGTITVQSTPDKGSIFSITIPNLKST